MHHANAIVAIGYRDMVKFLRDPPRLVATFVFPLIVIPALGGTFRDNLGDAFAYDFFAYVFTGVYAQTIFQSAALGFVSLLEDRENDFSQEIFVSPISRYAIITGKIIGESGVAMIQGTAIIAFGFVLGLVTTPWQAAGLWIVGIFICLLGGAFGIIMLSNLGSQRAAQQIFPFIILPQYFLAGVFNPIQILPLPLEVLSRMSPLRYAVDLARGAYYRGTDEYAAVVLDPPLFNLAVMAVIFAVFLVAGTFLFVRKERNR